MGIRFIIKEGQPDVPTAGLVAWWKMNSTDNNQILDYSGNANSLVTLGSPSVVTGIKDNAINLNDTGEQLYNQFSQFGLTDTMAVSMFVKVNVIGSTNTYTPLLCFQTGSNDGGLGLVKTYGGARIHVCRGRASNVQVHRYADTGSGHAPSTGVWYHYFAQYNGTTVELWVDVVNLFSVNYTGFGTFNSPYATKMAGNSTQFDWDVDNVRLYDITTRGLFSQAEIQQLYDEVN